MQQQQHVAEGTFSLVMREQDTALKRLHPICHPERVLAELVALATLGGHAHVSLLLGGHREHMNNTLALPYFQHQTFKEFFTNMKELDVKVYMKALFQSLEHIHQHGVMHRDIVSITSTLHC
jgi:cell division control protein 7